MHGEVFEKLHDSTDGKRTFEIQIPSKRGFGQLEGTEFLITLLAVGDATKGTSAQFKFGVRKDDQFFFERSQ